MPTTAAFAIVPPVCQTRIFPHLGNGGNGTHHRAFAAEDCQLAAFVRQIRRTARRHEHEHNGHLRHDETTQTVLSCGAIFRGGRSIRSVRRRPSGGSSHERQMMSYLQTEVREQSRRRRRECTQAAAAAICPARSRRLEGGPKPEISDATIGKQDRDLIDQRPRRPSSQFARTIREPLPDKQK